jgi:Tfp pilus assembly protein PilP
MKNYLAFIRIFVCLTASAWLLAGCADSDLAAAQPEVVRKKIGGPVEALAQSPQTAAPVAEQRPLVARVKSPDAAAPPANVNGPAAPGRSGVPPAPIAEPVRPVVATQPPVPAPEPQVRKLDTALALTDSQVAALLNLQAPAPYDPKGKADPFEPLLRDESVAPAGAKLVAKKRDPQSPLEKIDLGQLKLVAIIAAPSGNRALVEESSGKGYILREGTYVGQNSGKVVNIAIDKVMVEEEFEDAYGKTITQKKEITLPKPPGEL